MTSIILTGIWESLYMTIVSSIFAYLLGLPLGILLVVTRKDGLKPQRPVNLITGVVVNVFRSIPFLILLILIIPFTRLVVGTSIGSTAAIVPLTISAAPFIARLVESSLNEVDRGVIEAAQSMGASLRQIIFKVLLPEAKPSLLMGAAIGVTTILAYSAMAGIVGGGGLGDLAIKYGHYRYDSRTMFITTAFLVVIVQGFQAIGIRLVKMTDKRKTS